MSAYVKMGKVLPIGIVAKIVDYVWIKGADGVKQILHVGDALKSGDVITTGADGEVSIIFPDGSQMNLGSDLQETLSSKLYSDQSTYDELVSKLSAIQQAILTDQDPSTFLEAAGFSSGESNTTQNATMAEEYASNLQHGVDPSQTPPEPGGNSK